MRSEVVGPLPTDCCPSRFPTRAFAATS